MNIRFHTSNNNRFPHKLTILNYWSRSRKCIMILILMGVSGFTHCKINAAHTGGSVPGCELKFGVDSNGIILFIDFYGILTTSFSNSINNYRKRKNLNLHWIRFWIKNCLAGLHCYTFSFSLFWFIWDENVSSFMCHNVTFAHFYFCDLNYNSISNILIERSYIFQMSTYTPNFGFWGHLAKLFLLIFS